MTLNYCLLSLCYRVAPPLSVLSNYRTIFAHMWVWCQIMGLLQKLQCERNHNKSKKKDTLHFGLDQRK